MSFSTIPCGREKGVAFPASAPSMKVRQIGAAPVTPLVLTMGVKSALPTHTPATRSGV